MLRVPSISAVADAGHRCATGTRSTPTSANWEAPVKTSRLITQVCRTLNLDVTAIAPKETP